MHDRRLQSFQTEAHTKGPHAQHPTVSLALLGCAVSIMDSVAMMELASKRQPSCNNH